MSRSTVINETSTSVNGTFVLHDLLYISTKSGSINITVIPQPASSSKTSAELRLSTASGSIEVKMAPLPHLPSTVIHERIFNSFLESMSGSITVVLAHNSKTSLSTMSGNITASLYPLGQPSSMSHVDVCSMSGSTSMILHPYINSPQASLRSLSMDFRGSSGALKVRLPSTWEGEVISHLSSGRVRHEWEGLRVLQDGPKFTATKGNGLGQLNIWGNSMNVELVGERMLGVSGLSIQWQVKGEGESVPIIPCMPELPREVEVRTQTELMPNLPTEAVWLDEEEIDDDWTVVGDEDGVQEVTKRPPPTYEDAMRR